MTRFDLSKDGTRLLVTLSGQLYVVNRADLKVTALPGKNWIDPRFSGDGTAVAAVSAGELHVIERRWRHFILRQHLACLQQQCGDGQHHPSSSDHMRLVQSATPAEISS